MKTQYTVEVAPTAVWSLQDAESWNAIYNSDEIAADWADELFKTSIAAISEEPTRYRFNAMMADKGVQIRERIALEHDFRCLYDCDEESNKIEILLFVSMKQDLLSMLYRYLVLN